MTTPGRQCGPLYDQICAYMDDDAPIPEPIIALALRHATSTWAGAADDDLDDDGALEGHHH